VSFVVQLLAAYAAAAALEVQRHFEQQKCDEASKRRTFIFFPTMM